jgi:threonine/homoserine/homoserine lactone efflux protein
VLSGLTVWVVTAALGLSAVLRASEDAYLALRIAGAVYLVWIGIQSLRSRGQVAAEDSKRRAIVGQGYTAGLMTDLLNPKVGVFFVTFLPGLVPKGADVGTTSLLFGAIFIVETMIYFATMLLAVERLTGWLRNDVVRRRIERLSGCVLIAFGVRLAVEA